MVNPNTAPFGNESEEGKDPEEEEAEKVRSLFEIGYDNKAEDSRDTAKDEAEDRGFTMDGHLGEFLGIKKEDKAAEPAEKPPENELKIDREPEEPIAAAAAEQPAEEPENTALEANEPPLEQTVETPPVETSSEEEKPPEPEPVLPVETPAETPVEAEEEPPAPEPQNTAPEVPKEVVEPEPVPEVESAPEPPQEETEEPAAPIEEIPADQVENKETSSEEAEQRPPEGDQSPIISQQEAEALKEHVDSSDPETTPAGELQDPRETAEPTDNESSPILPIEEIKDPEPEPSDKSRAPRVMKPGGRPINLSRTEKHVNSSETIEKPAADPDEPFSKEKAVDGALEALGAIYASELAAAKGEKPLGEEEEPYQGPDEEPNEETAKDTEPKQTEVEHAEEIVETAQEERPGGDNQEFIGSQSQEINRSKAEDQVESLSGQAETPQDNPETLPASPEISFDRHQEKLAKPKNDEDFSSQFPEADEPTPISDIIAAKKQTIRQDPTAYQEFEYGKAGLKQEPELIKSKYKAPVITGVVAGLAIILLLIAYLLFR